MANNEYRTIKITYNVTTLSIVIQTKNENVRREELSSIRQTIDASRYKQITGTSKTFEYNFDNVSSAVFDFFDTAYNNSETYDLTLEREQDDGTFDSQTVLMDRPQWEDKSVTTDNKAYKNLSVRMYSA